MCDPTLHIKRVPITARKVFRQMAENYWRDLMPDADVLKSSKAIEAYFSDTFIWQNGNRHPYWAQINNQPIGFISFATENKTAYVHDFYVASEHRRKGYGSAIVQWLFAHLDQLGIERLDLNVRRDTPDALAFWQAQGFGIAGYSLRMYRDPQTGTAYKGVLSSDFAK